MCQECADRMDRWGSGEDYGEEMGVSYHGIELSVWENLGSEEECVAVVVYRVVFGIHPIWLSGMPCAEVYWLCKDTS